MWSMLDRQRDTPANEDIAPGPGNPWAFLASHRAFLTVLTLAVALRGGTMLGYRWAMWFPDSYDYVTGALTLTPNLIRPSGYALFLRALEPFHSLAMVTLLQHGMGIGVGVLIYRLLRIRFGLPGWAATIAACPVLLDGFQVQLEHLILADTLFMFLVMCSVSVLLRTATPTRTVAALVGLLFGLAAITKSMGLPLLAVGLGYMLINRAGWRTIAVTVLACAAPLTLYATWFSVRHDRFALTSSTGVFLYGRTMTFADCAKMRPPAEELPLCETLPPDRRPPSQDYIWGLRSPLHRLRGRPFSPYEDRLAGDFATRAIRAQPLDYLEVTGTDLMRTFQWKRTVVPDAFTYSHYLFRTQADQPPETARSKMEPYDPGHLRTRVVEPYAGWLRTYQSRVVLPGTMLGLVLLAGLAGVTVRRRKGGGQSLLPWGIAAALIVVPPATAQFDYRYVLPAVPAACLAAALAFRRPPDHQ
jgi:hypothetical protein